MKAHLTRSAARLPQSGFSLVITIALMVLLTLLAVGMMGLATVSLRKGHHVSTMEEARTNARFALEQAIAQLQKHAGPDQRVTAESAFGVSSDPDSAPSGVKHPHWVGVWRTTLEDGSPLILRNAENGGLHDAREDGDWDIENDLLTELVSGNESQLIYRSDRASDGEEMQLLVGPGSVGDSLTQDYVSAPKVRIGEDNKAGGEYAWWVGDLGTRANISTPDRFDGPQGDDIRRLQIAQDQSATAFGSDSELSNEERSKMLSPATLKVSEGLQDAVKQHYFDFTTDSESLLVDVREGGLKKDLTAFIEGNGETGEMESEGMAGVGLGQEDPIIGPPNDLAAEVMEDGSQAYRLNQISPTFGLIRHWAKRAEKLGLSTRQMSASFSPTRARDDDKMQSYGGQNLYPVEYKNRQQSDVQPVLTEGSIYYNISYFDTGSTDTRRKYGLRLHLYPRVVLWNPYNVALKVNPSMLGLQINGAKQVEIIVDNAGKEETLHYRMSWGNLLGTGGAFERWRRGSHYFKLAATTLEPGESVVFSPSGNMPYDQSNFGANLLTPSQRPDPTRSFYMDKRDDGDFLFEVAQSFPPDPRIVSDYLKAPGVRWREVVPGTAAGNVQQSGYTQADDYWMYWKPFPSSSASGTANLRTFASLPHGQYVSCAFQYGDEDELPVQWSDVDPVPMMESTQGGVVQQVPDRRTRDGFRLRWLNEHASNIMGSGSLAGTPHFQTATIANWNVRAAYSFRSAFENVTDVAPHFFGAYTRDLFDDAISWNQLTPRSSGGTAEGDPFDQPNAGQRRILFDLPRTGGELVSLGALQHLKFSELVWHPTYAFGNSLADPRISTDMTEPDRSERDNEWEGGWNRDTIGYSTDGRSNNPTTYNSDSWAQHARGLLEQTARDQDLIFDLSYELNYSLWDRYFLSTGTPSDKGAFLDDPVNRPLPNGRLQPTLSATEEDLADFHHAASALTLQGGFNVNSMSVSAWESLLLSSAGVRTDDNKVLFPRILEPKGKEWDGANPRSEAAWDGQRTLSRDEIRSLAESIVTEVRKRGPFLGLSDFVNRRLSLDETGKMGALEAALSTSGINQSFDDTWPVNNDETLPNYNHIDNIKDPTRIEQTLKPNSNAWGALGFVTQADLLQSLGPVLTARSDTFVVRAYGNAVDKNGKVLAEAWCEAVVQRQSDPVNPDKSGINPDVERNVDFGRRFTTKRFRWLHRDEI
ncbi:hypothetical protein HNR46_001288 [Haloferula luteola]|uniref:Uncharacterized protein n=1 Tax=Haloferula luteola TaxID=595692 RepID=A0A840V603_9BACT|nr:hypothetical protein [Haloferula luteola]MBB5351054.1 hypothetical protein [Haloferula luteola]